MLDQPLISVIVNCYNGENFINRCITSILKQTYENFEIIFWNNKSTDNTLNIIKKYDDIRIKIFNSETHTNLSYARNNAIKNSKGEYICFLDVDDYWDKNKLEKQIKSFTSDEIGFSFTNFWYVNSHKLKEKKMINLTFENGLINKMVKNYQIVLSTIMVRKKVIENLKNPFNDDYHIIGDFDFTLSLAQITKFYHLKNHYTYRVWHGQNESLTKPEITVSEIEKWIKRNSNNYDKYQSEIFFLKKKVYCQKINLNIKNKKFINAFNIFYTGNINFKLSYLKGIFLKLYSFLKNLI